MRRLTRPNLDADPKIAKHEGDGSREREAASIGAHAEAKSKTMSAGLVKERAGTLKIARPRRELRRIRVGEREEALGDGAAPPELCPYEELTIERVEERLPHAFIGERWMLKVHPKIGRAGAALGDNLKIIVLIKERQKKRRDGAEGEIAAPTEEAEGARIFIAHDDKLHARMLKLAAVIIVIFFEDQP